MPASSIYVQAAKVLTFHEAGVLNLYLLVGDLIIGASLMAGAFVFEALLHQRLGADFRLMMDAITLASGPWLTLAELFG